MPFSAIFGCALRTSNAHSQIFFAHAAASSTPSPPCNKRSAFSYSPEAVDNKTLFINIASLPILASSIVSNIACAFPTSPEATSILSAVDLAACSVRASPSTPLVAQIRPHTLNAARYSFLFARAFTIANNTSFRLCFHILVEAEAEAEEAPNCTSHFLANRVSFSTIPSSSTSSNNKIM